MKHAFLAAFAALSLAALAGCASDAGTPKTVAFTGTHRAGVQGKDLGRGGATSGGVSSLSPSGNAADHSPLAGGF